MNLSKSGALQYAINKIAALERAVKQLTTNDKEIVAAIVKNRENLPGVMRYEAQTAVAKLIDPDVQKKMADREFDRALDYQADERAAAQRQAQAKIDAKHKALDAKYRDDRKMVGELFGNLYDIINQCSVRLQMWSWAKDKKKPLLEFKGIAADLRALNAEVKLKAPARLAEFLAAPPENFNLNMIDEVWNLYKSDKAEFYSAVDLNYENMRAAAE